MDISKAIKAMNDMTKPALVKKANLVEAAKQAFGRLLIPGLAGGAAGVGGAALYDYMNRPESPPPEVMQVAEMLQRVNPDLSWEDALEYAYEGLEEYTEETEKESSLKISSVSSLSGQAEVSRQKVQLAEKIADNIATAKIAFIAGISHQFGNLSKLSARADAPNYRKSTGSEKCATCTFFDDGTCTKWDFQANKEWVCDSWKSKEAVDFGDMPLDLARSSFIKREPESETEAEEKFPTEGEEMREQKISAPKNVPQEWQAKVQKKMKEVGGAKGPGKLKKVLQKADTEYKAKEEKMSANRFFMGGFLQSLEKKAERSIPGDIARSIFGAAPVAAPEGRRVGTFFRGLGRSVPAFLGGAAVGGALGGGIGSLVGGPIGAPLGVELGAALGSGIGGSWGAGTAIANAWEKEVAERVAEEAAKKAKLLSMLKYLGAGGVGAAGLYGLYNLLKESKETKKMESKKSAEKWIQKAIEQPGALKKQLGVPKEEKIPAAKLETAAEKGGKLGRRARLAQTLKGLGKRK